ncbi:MAG: sialidase family protein [Chloroflexota bacterium]
MNAFARSRSRKVTLFVIVALAVILAVLPYTSFYHEWLLSAPFSEVYGEWIFEGKAKIRQGGVQLETINASPENRAVAAPPGSSGFTTQVRLGFTSGDQWEPAIASDRFGHVYVLYPQYLGVPGCEECSNPTMILQVSSDSGSTWASPRIIYPAGAVTGGQWDAQITIDPVDGQTVYAAWLQNNKCDIIVARSTDFGANWTFVIADETNAATDKPILAVYGQHVSVGYNHAQQVWVSSSHDGGATFDEVKINQNGKLGWALAGGGTITPNGSIYFAWAGYEQNGGARGNVNLYVSRSTDGGATWTNKVIDVSAAPPDCSAFLCGWAYLGAQMTMASDSAGTIYLLWNSGSTAREPERIYFAKSTNGGNTYTTKFDVSAAPAGTHHAFPAIAATGNGDIRISWMDARASANGGMDRWNVYYRSSTNGGSTWSSEVDLSAFVEGYPTYIFTDGFRFPFGDYYELDIDANGVNHVIFGIGESYDSPGSIWYVKGK